MWGEEMKRGTWLGPGRGQLTFSHSEAKKPGGLGTACAMRLQTLQPHAGAQGQPQWTLCPAGPRQQLWPRPARAGPAVVTVGGQAAALSSHFSRVIGATRENNEREECE